MVKPEALIGELLDETTLTSEELALACCVEQQWVIERVEAGILKGNLTGHANWRFVSQDLARARRLISIERCFDADAELAALVADLIEELDQLKQQLRVVKMASE